jgi:DNA invertase Pin-like site-specific DNA recombinase
MSALVAYCRVSTNGQAEDGLGLDVQRDAIRRWAAGNGHKVVAWFEDAGISGSNELESRTGLADALVALKDRRAAGLCVAKLDRLARSLTVQEGTLRKVWDLGAVVYSADLGEVPEDDADDPMRTALRQMVGVFAQLERGMIAARMRAGRAKKASTGGYAGGGPPYGWRAVDGELVPVEDEQAVIAMVRRLRGEGRSWAAIAAALNTSEVPSRRGGRWYAATARRVARRPPRDGSAASSSPADANVG